MKHSNKIISTCFSVALGMFALTGCESGELLMLMLQTGFPIKYRK